MSEILKIKSVSYSVYAFCLVISLYACFSLFKIITTSAPDFEVYYGATKQLVSGINPYAQSELYTGFGYPPFTAMVFLPFLLAPLKISQGIFIVLSFVSIPFIVWMLVSLFKNKAVRRIDIFVYSSIVFLLFPTRFTLGMGQSNLITLLFICASLFVWKRSKSIFAGILFGVAICFKPHLILLLPFMLLTGEWVFVTRSLGIVLGAGIGSILLFGAERYFQYFTDMVMVLLPYSGRGIYYNQGFAGFFARMIPQQPAELFTVVSSCILYGFGLLSVWKNRISLPLAISLGLCIMVLIEPLSWQHHGVFLLPSCFFLVSLIRKYTLSVFIFVCSLFLIGYNIRQPLNFETGSIGMLILSHGFVGTMEITGLMLFAVRKQRI